MSIGQPRNLIIVLNKLKEKIPDHETHFKEDIDKAIESASFAAPEMIHVHWNIVQSILSKRFEKYKDIKDISEWEDELIKIWTNRI